MFTLLQQLKLLFPNCHRVLLLGTRKRWKNLSKESFLWKSITNVETLWGIHNKIIAPMLDRFKREIEHYLPASSEADACVERKKKDQLLTFEGQICLQSENGEVISGAFRRFVMENIVASRQHCQQVQLKAFRDVREKLQQAATEQSEVDMSTDLLTAEKNYFQMAIGPAKTEVHTKVRQKLEEDHRDSLLNIPGRPINLRSTGAAKDKINLQWVDPGAVVYYNVRSMYGNSDWEILPNRFSDQNATIETLKSGTEYRFQVRGVGVTGIIGNWSDTYKCSTTFGNLKRGAATVGSFLGGMITAPVAGLFSIPISGPVGPIIGTIIAPFAAGVLAKHVAERYGPQGDLKQVPAGEDRSALPPPEECNLDNSQ